MTNSELLWLTPTWDCHHYKGSINYMTTLREYSRLSSSLYMFLHLPDFSYKSEMHTPPSFRVLGLPLHTNGQPHQESGVPWVLPAVWLFMQRITTSHHTHHHQHPFHIRSAPHDSSLYPFFRIHVQTVTHSGIYMPEFVILKIFGVPCVLYARIHVPCIQHTLPKIRTAVQ